MKEVKLKVSADTKNAEKGMKNLDNSIQGTVKTLITATAGLYAMKKGFDFMKDATKLAMEQEKIFVNLSASVEMTGVSYANVDKELQKMFTTLQATTEYGDTDSAKVLNTLIDLTGNYKQSVKYLGLTLDMASTSMFSTESASRYLGMALAGNIEMLGRYVPELKSSNNELLKTMTNTEKTAYAMDLLQSKFGGMAEKQMTSTTKKLKQMSNYWGDIKEQIGNEFIPVVEYALELMDEFLDLGIKEGKENQAMLEKTKDLMAESTETERKMFNIKMNLLQSRFELEMHNLETIKKANNDWLDYEQRQEQEKLENKLNKIKIYKEAWLGFYQDLANKETTTPTKMSIIFDESLWDDVDEQLEAVETIESTYDEFIENKKKKDEEYAKVKKQLDDEDMARRVKNIALSANSASSAMKNVVKNETMEATAGYLASVLTTVPYPLNLLLAAAGGGVVAGLMDKALSSIPSFSGGGDFVVPNGYPNDSYPILVESGERVQITPASGGNSNLDGDILNALHQLISKPVANTVVFDDIDMSRYVESGTMRRDTI